MHVQCVCTSHERDWMLVNLISCLRTQTPPARKGGRYRQRTVHETHKQGNPPSLQQHPSPRHRPRQRRRQQQRATSDLSYSLQQVEVVGATGLLRLRGVVFVRLSLRYRRPRRRSRPSLAPLATFSSSATRPSFRRALCAAHLCSGSQSRLVCVFPLRRCRRFSLYFTQRRGGGRRRGGEFTGKIARVAKELSVY